MTNHERDEAQERLIETLTEALKQAAMWLRNGDYDTRGGLAEMDRLASICEGAIASADATAQARKRIA